MAPTGHTCAAASPHVEIGVGEAPRRRVDDHAGVDAAIADVEHVLAVDVAAGAHAQVAQDAAVVVEQDVRMRRVDTARRIEMIEPVRHELQVIGDRLQLAVAALLAGGTDVVAFDEQHLGQRAAVVVERRRVVLDHDPFPRLGGARGRGLAVDVDRAQLAASVRHVARPMAQMRDVDAGFGRGVDDRLAGAERHRLAVDDEVAAVHRELASSTCAAMSSRPVIWRAVSSAPSTSNAGS